MPIDIKYIKIFYISQILQTKIAIMENAKFPNFPYKWRKTKKMYKNFEIYKSYRNFVSVAFYKNYEDYSKGFF